MASRGVIVLFPRKLPEKRSLGARLRTSIADVVADVVTFERTHARLAWSVTAIGLVIGLALQSL